MAATITVVCPYCKNRMRASAEHVGRKGRCPNCRKLVEIAATDLLPGTIHPSTPPTGRGLPDARLSSTDVSTGRAGAIGMAVTVALYLVVFWPVQGTSVGDLFLARGPMQYCTTLVTCWGLAILALKYLAVKRQLRCAELELKLIPLDIGLQITPSNVEQFLQHQAELPGWERLSILGRRIEGALEHFKSRQSVPEVQQYLATQAELDASGVDAGYSLLRSFIFVIPLLGFIGTVTGISSAVTGMDAIMRQGTDSEHLMSGLGQVTAGLAVAFDTTFLALMMAIVLLFPTESLRKTEYGMLDRIESFANESLLRRMADEQQRPGQGELPNVVSEAMQSAFREHQKWLAQWQAQVAQLGQTIGADFELAFHRLEERVCRTETQRLENAHQLSQLWDEMFQKAEQATADWQQSATSMCAQSKNLESAVDELRQSLTDGSKLMTETLTQQRRIWAQYAESDFSSCLSSLSEQIGKLRESLASDKRPLPEDQTETLAILQSEPSADTIPRRRSLLRRLFRWRQ